MKKKMLVISCICIIVTVLAAVIYVCMEWGVWLTIAISFGTVAYHFVMRFLVGMVFNAVMKNRADYHRKWYQLHPWESTFYKKMQVKRWKEKMPTFDESLFSPRIHTWKEIAEATCQAELVHETIMVLSFLPIIAGIWFGAYPVFIITSIVAALIDGMFVVMQRYNRPRIIRILERASSG